MEAKIIEVLDQVPADLAELISDRKKVISSGKSVWRNLGVTPFLYYVRECIVLHMERFLRNIVMSRPERDLNPVLGIVCLY